MAPYKLLLKTSDVTNLNKKISEMNAVELSTSWPDIIYTEDKFITNIRRLFGIVPTPLCPVRSHYMECIKRFLLCRNQASTHVGYLEPEGFL